MAAILIDNQSFVQQFGQPIGLLGIVVDQLDIDLVLQFGRNAYADARTAEDHHVVDLHVGMPRELHHLLHGILPGDDIHHVALHKYFILPGDDGLTAASDRHRPIAELRRIVLETRKFASDERRGRIKTENHERKPSARKIDVLRRRSVPQQIDHLLSRHLFRIEQVVDTHVDKNLLVIGLQVFVVVDPGDGFLGPELLGQHRCHHVVVLDMIDSDEQVALSHRSLPQHGKGRGVALDRQHVGQAGHIGQQLRIAVYDRDVVPVATEHFRQMASHFARTRNNDFHTGFTLSAYARIIPGSIFAINNTNV